MISSQLTWRFVRRSYSVYKSILSNKKRSQSPSDATGALTSADQALLLQNDDATGPRYAKLIIDFTAPVFKLRNSSLELLCFPSEASTSTEHCMSRIADAVRGLRTAVATIARTANESRSERAACSSHDILRQQGQLALIMIGCLMEALLAMEALATPEVLRLAAMVDVALVDYATTLESLMVCLNASVGALISSHLLCRLSPLLPFRGGISRPQSVSLAP